MRWRRLKVPLGRRKQVLRSTKWEKLLDRGLYRGAYAFVFSHTFLFNVHYYKRLFAKCTRVLAPTVRSVLCALALAYLRFCWVSDELPADRRTGRIICLLFIPTDSCLLWSHSTRLSRRWRLTDRGTTLCFLLWTASQVCQGPRKHWRGSYFKTRLSRALVLRCACCAKTIRHEVPLLQISNVYVYMYVADENI